MGFVDWFRQLRHGWSAFSNRDPTYNYFDIGMGNSTRPDRSRFSRGAERSIATAIYNRIALDVANIKITHCRVDDGERFVNEIDSSLNNCLNLEANIDQTGQAFKQDICMSMLDEGCVAIIPTITSTSPLVDNSYEILSMRTGKILEWYPKHIKIRMYSEITGQYEDYTFPKKMVAIVENPFYAVMNESNSTMQRLIRKLALLDAVDDRNSSGKLDLIIQLPWSTRNELKRKQADKRRDDLLEQIQGPLGVAYIDSTEKVIQLNRPLENNLMAQIEYLTTLLFSQLGINQSILDGSANESTMLNYYSRIIEPIVSSIVYEMKRKFLTKTARTQNQTIKFYRDPFKLVPMESMAELADKLTRNEILTSNEIRQIMGFKPSDDPKADQLINSNLNHPEEQIAQKELPKESEEITDPKKEQKKTEPKLKQDKPEKVTSKNYKQILGELFP